MRVIAGVAKGRRLVAPPGDRTRPTTDRVREALFSSLAPRLVGARVLDAYAGSGALGIEALSRGAATATFVEHDRRALEALRRNLATTGLGDRATVLARDVAAALARDVGPVDVALLDPPYATHDTDLAAVLAALAPLLAVDAVVVVERDTRAAAPSWPPGVLPERRRRYGDTTLHVGVREGPNP